jgi:hypothetical protein
MAFDSVEEERGLTLLDGMGDVELTWDSKDDERVRALIEKKMREGVTFFVIKPLIGDAIHTKRRLKDVRDLKSNSVKIKDKDVIDLAVKVKDPDIAEIVSAGHARLFRANEPIDPKAEMVAVRVRDREGNLDHAAASKRAVRQRTVGVKALQGG